MAKVNQQDMGEGIAGPSLAPYVLDNADVAVLTIEQAATGVTTKIGRRPGALTFSDAPTDKRDNRPYVLWLVKSDVRTLVAKLGDDTDRWEGQRVPLALVTVQNPETGQDVQKYQVADPDDWADIFKSYDTVATPPKKATAK